MHHQRQPTGNIYWKPAHFPVPAQVPKIIVHVDDQSIYRKGLFKLFQNALPGVLIKQFSNKTTAVLYIADLYARKGRLATVVTDLQRAQDSGVALAQQLKAIEAEYNYRTPILLFTCCPKHPCLTPLYKSYFETILCKDQTDSLREKLQQILQP